MFRQTQRQKVTALYTQLMNQNDYIYRLNYMLEYIKHGADTSATNKDGHTLLQCLYLPRIEICKNYLKGQNNHQDDVHDLTVAINQAVYTTTKVIDAGYCLNESEKQLVDEFIISLYDVDSVIRESKNERLEQLMHKEIMRSIDELNACISSQEKNTPTPSP